MNIIVSVLGMAVPYTFVTRKCYSSRFSGLLNLDIAWCYLHLGNMSELPNAEQRLHECEETFAKTYGANLERLNSVKGTADAEAVLLLRLRLLKAIVAFHNGHKGRSIDLVRIHIIISSLNLKAGF